MCGARLWFRALQPAREWVGPHPHAAPHVTDRQR